VHQAPGDSGLYFICSFMCLFNTSAVLGRAQHSYFGGGFGGALLIRSWGWQGISPLSWGLSVIESRWWTALRLIICGSMSLTSWGAQGGHRGVWLLSEAPFLETVFLQGHEHWVQNQGRV
jgi:hypothetical protein